MFLLSAINYIASGESKSGGLNKEPDKELTIIDASSRDDHKLLSSLADVQQNIRQKSARDSSFLVPVYRSVRRFPGPKQVAKSSTVIEPTTSTSARSSVIYDPNRFREIEGPSAATNERNTIDLNAGQEQPFVSSPVFPFPYPYPYPGSVAAFPVPHGYPVLHPYNNQFPYFPQPNYFPSFSPYYHPYHPYYPIPYPVPNFNPYLNHINPYSPFIQPQDLNELSSQLSKLIRKNSNNSASLSKAAKS